MEGLNLRNPTEPNIDYSLQGAKISILDNGVINRLGNVLISLRFLTISILKINFTAAV